MIDFHLTIRLIFGKLTYHLSRMGRAQNPANFLVLIMFTYKEEVIGWVLLVGGPFLRQGIQEEIMPDPENTSETSDADAEGASPESESASDNSSESTSTEASDQSKADSAEAAESEGEGDEQSSESPSASTTTETSTTASSEGEGDDETLELKITDEQSAAAAQQEIEDKEAEEQRFMQEVLAKSMGALAVFEGNLVDQLRMVEAGSERQEESNVVIEELLERLGRSESDREDAEAQLSGFEAMMRLKNSPTLLEQLVAAMLALATTSKNSAEQARASDNKSAERTNSVLERARAALKADDEPSEDDNDESGATSDDSE